MKRVIHGKAALVNELELHRVELIERGESADTLRERNRAKSTAAGVEYALRAVRDTDLHAELRKRLDDVRAKRAKRDSAYLNGQEDILVALLKEQT